MFVILHFFLHHLTGESPKQKPRRQYNSLATLESKGLPGLYACGELLDIDGDCGGYNLQWAWSSGFVAGKSAAVSLLSHSQPPAEANS